VDIDRFCTIVCGHLATRPEMQALSKHAYCTIYTQIHTHKIRICSYHI